MNAVTTSQVEQSMYELARQLLYSSYLPLAARHLLPVALNLTDSGCCSFKVCPFRRGARVVFAFAAVGAVALRSAF